MDVILLVACAENGVIGREGQLPWRLSSDLQRFKARTMGHVLLMGRKTCESIGRLLPGRTTVVLTRQAAWSFPGAHVAHTWEEALEQAAALTEGDRPVFVVGGAEIYRLALPHATQILLTRVHAHVAGDTVFPELDPHQWRCVSESWHPADARNDHAHTFQTWDRQVPGFGR